MTSVIIRKTAPTLIEFLSNNTKSGYINNNFVTLMQSIQQACKLISNACRNIHMVELNGINGTKQINESGDIQKKLDIFADECFVNCLKSSQLVYVMGSEEHKDPIFIKNVKDGYAVVFDPLDGSSNIDANIPVGSIFGIYGRNKQKEHILRPGIELIAAGYCLYSSSTIMVLATNSGVNGFTLDELSDEFVLTNPCIRIPKRGNIYSCNEGNYLNWAPYIKKYIELCKQIGYKARYVGSMVADIHRTLLYGGIFMYPADIKEKHGKLRLMYECNPIAMLIEQAGGKTIIGYEWNDSANRNSVLDIIPKTLHQKCPIICGSSDNILEIESIRIQAQIQARLQSKL